MTSLNTVAVIGMGALGKVLSEKLSLAGLNVPTYDRFLEKQGTPLEECLEISQIVFLCTPTSATSEISKAALSSPNKDLGIVSFSKGVSEEGKTAAEILEMEAGDLPWAVVGGPILSHEIREFKSAFAVVGSDNTELRQDVTILLRKMGLQAVASDKPFVISYYGVLKNVYTMAFGIAEALKLGKNFDGALFAAAQAEISIILKNAGLTAGEDIGSLLTNLGDLMTCAISEHSQHRKAGVRVVVEKEVTHNREGVRSVKILCQRLSSILPSLPILSIVADIMEKKSQPDKIKEAVYKHLNV